MRKFIWLLVPPDWETSTTRWSSIRWKQKVVLFGFWVFGYRTDHDGRLLGLGKVGRGPDGWYLISDSVITVDWKIKSGGQGDAAFGRRFRQDLQGWQPAHERAGRGLKCGV